jgi:hypothetical protein
LRRWDRQPPIQRRNAEAGGCAQRYPRVLRQDPGQPWNPQAQSPSPVSQSQNHLTPPAGRFSAEATAAEGFTFSAHASATCLMGMHPITARPRCRIPWCSGWSWCRWR